MSNQRQVGGALAMSFTVLAVGTAGLVGAAGVMGGGTGLGALRVPEALERAWSGWTRFRPAAEPVVMPSSAPPAAAPVVATEATRPVQAARTTAPLPARPSALGGSLVVLGDRLKVSFFESVAVPLGDAAKDTAGDAAGEPTSRVTATVFPRTDLSGEYQVDEAGGLDIPRLGRHEAAGRGVATLEAGLAQAFAEAFGRPGLVHVALLERRPVYVLGGARGGTTVRHAPGLIVLQALAEAGGTGQDGAERGGPDTSRAIERIRETQRLGEAQDRLARALVRQARLLALRDGLPGIVLPRATAALLAEALPDDGVELLREANGALARDRRGYAERLALASRQVDIAALDLAAQTGRVAQLRALADSKARRLREMEEVAARGSVSQFRLADTVIDVAEAVARQEDGRTAVAQAQSRLTEAEIERAKLEQARERDVALDLAASAQEVSDLRRALTAIGAVLALLDERNQASGAGAAHRPGLSILRPAPGGTALLPATDTTPLLPGDVLRIEPRTAATTLSHQQP